GKLSIEDPVAQFIPEFGRLQTPKPITLRHLLTHTSGLPGMPPRELGDLYGRRDRTLAEAVPLFARPPAFEPGTKWAYCNTGIDVLGRVVEVASGKRFEDFLEERIFRPLGMKDTFFYPTPQREGRIARLYRKDAERLVPVEPFLGDAPHGKYPLPAGGLYSTAPDLARLYQMMLDRGAAGGRRLLSEAAVARMTAEQLGGMAAGFAPGMGMGLGWQVVREPQGVTAALSPGSYGHGGAFGTQGWIDPKRDAFYILLVQRSNFPNADRSDLRRALQDGAAAAFLD
ncbi:MAG: serine hydrolase domain-containing protein, partial [Planctomycetota bacterium]